MLMPEPSAETQVSPKLLQGIIGGSRMPDVVAIGSALASIKTIFDLLKGANDGQFAMRVSAEVANIQGQLIDVQQQTLRIQQENQELRSEVDRFKVFRQHHSVLWRENNTGGEDGPFCPVCHSDGRETRLAIAPRYDQTREYWTLWCPKSHIDPRVKPQGFTPMKGEPTYRVPKHLVPADYFSA
jgi:hypothetical protein